LSGGKGLERMAVAMAGEELVEAIKRREEKLTKAENLTMKFLEVKFFLINITPNRRAMVTIELPKS
jgi:hypothetical protein